MPKRLTCLSALLAGLVFFTVPAVPAGHAATPAAPPVVTASGPIEVSHERLASGLRVVLAKTPPVEGQEPRAHVAAYVLHGTMQEQWLGWAHLMEHVVANNRSATPGPNPPPGLRPFNSNALARPYHTSFLAVVPPALVPAAIYSRMAKAGRTLNDEGVYAREVERVVDELERDADTLYPAYTALARLALGTSPAVRDEIDSVRGAHRAEVEAAMSLIYVPQNTVLVVAGDIDIQQTLAAVREMEHSFGWDPAGEPRDMARFAPLNWGRSAIVPGQNRSDRYVVGVAWPHPPVGSPDLWPLLIADQVLLGGREDPAAPKRSDNSPMGRQLAQRLGGSEVWDRIDGWSAAPSASLGPGFLAAIFRTQRETSPDEVTSAVSEALVEVGRNELGDAAIERAKETLAAFYEGWLLEPNYRVLSDHLMAYAVSRDDLGEVQLLPSRIRAIQAPSVREAFHRYLVESRPNIVILPPEVGHDAF